MSKHKATKSETNEDDRTMTGTQVEGQTDLTPDPMSQPGAQTTDEQLATSVSVRHPYMRNEEVHTRLGVLRMNAEGCVANLEEILGEDGDKESALKYLREVGFFTLDTRITGESHLDVEGLQAGDGAEEVKL